MRKKQKKVVKHVQLNPGSPEAIEAGCRCPVMDNCNGEGYTGIKGMFIYSQDCDLHWRKEWSK